MYDSFQYTKQYDILVVGAGLAGIKAALTCAEKNKSVLQITSSTLCSGSSFYPLMDSLHCLCTSGDEDKEIFLKDIEDCSYNMNDSYMAKYYINHIDECINELPSMGIEYDKLPEEKLACFAKHPRKIYYWKDWKKLKNNVTQVMSTKKSITLNENTEIICILTKDNHIAGAVLRHKNNEVETIAVKSIILASGGFGGLYLHNLNTSDVNGSVQAMALKAGASLINIEFNQFIPGFLNPLYKTVFREGSLRHCTGLFDQNGTNLLKQRLPDELDYKACLSQRETHGPFTTTTLAKHFDIALMKSALNNIEANDGKINRSVGSILKYSDSIKKDNRQYVLDYIKWLQNDYNVDITKDTIMIAPFFHAANGGIYIDHKCETSIYGLFSCGEAAGGIHGADRIGGMASGSCLVFGKLAGLSASIYSENVDYCILSSTSIKEQLELTYTVGNPIVSTTSNFLKLPSKKDDTTQNICQRIKELMWQHASIIRTENGLLNALHEIDNMAESNRLNTNIIDYINGHRSESIDDFRSFIKAHHFITLSRALLISMLERKESRGAHYREDYPNIDEKNYSNRIIIKHPIDSFYFI